MSFLYLTADQVGSPSGGGRVTQEESTALFDLSVERGEECRIWGREELQRVIDEKEADPWKWDKAAAYRFHAHQQLSAYYYTYPELAHFYAGTFSDTIRSLKKGGTKIAYTAAAHDVMASHTEHLKLGLDFPYSHLTDPALWDRYVEGYRQADVVICPSQHSAECMERYGCKNIEIIPHGCNLPEETFSLPQEFSVGYLGCCSGPDKGLVYLLQAWKKLAYPDAVLYLAGRDSESYFVQELIRLLDVRNVELKGWVDQVSSFYHSISLYIQPSVTEGFGIEVLEALAQARPVLCSAGAGAADVVPDTWRFPAADVDALAEKIDQFRKADLALMGQVGRGLAQEYTWDKIRKRYQDCWTGLLG